MIRVRPIIALAALALSACDGVDEDSAISVSVIGPRASIGDPNRKPLDAPAAAMSAAVLQGLVAYDARGEIEPGLAERWIVTDDGLSYIFRIKRATWSDGQPVSADEVAKSLRTSLASGSVNAMKPMLYAVTDIVAMTDRVIEIRLSTPQPGILHIFAQPEMAISRRGRGSGPYRIHRRFPNSFVLQPVLAEGSSPSDVDEQAIANATRKLRGESAAHALARFDAGEAALVLAGRFDDYLLARAAGVPNSRIRRDLSIGVFGLAVMRGSKVLDSPDRRAALAMAIDRTRLLSRFGIAQWRPVETLLPGPIEGLREQARPDWTALDQDDRITRARSIASSWRGEDGGRPVVRIAIPDGPGGRILFAQLAADWNAIGIDLRRASAAFPADLRLVDQVAPAPTALWFLQAFGCKSPYFCSEAAEKALTEARTATDLDTRATKLAEADTALAASQNFIPIASPLRWSAVDPSLSGYRENATAFHALNRLRKATN